MSVPTRCVEQFGDLATLEQENQIAQKSHEALITQYQELIEQHPNRWVAFHDGKLVCTGKDLETVLAETDTRQIPRSTLVLEYLDPQPRVMVL